jgi:hypothetical protein
MHKKGGVGKDTLVRRTRALLAIIALGILIIVSILFIQAKDKYKIPGNIKSQLDFPVLFLKKPTDEYTLNATSIKYATQPDGSKVFSYIVLSSNNQITFSEQAYPEVLIYDKFTNSLNPYSEVGALYGKVTLGKPKDSGGRQVAAFKYTDSTLIFAQPKNNLSDSQWQKLINSLEPEQ